MELKDFVATALREVVEGIQIAQQTSTAGALIAPSNIGGHEFSADSGVSFKARIISTVVKFDVAVTAESADASRGGGGVKVAAFGMGVGGGIEESTSSRNASVSRLQFSVPVMIPPNKQNWGRLVEEAGEAFKAARASA